MFRIIKGDSKNAKAISRKFTPLRGVNLKIAFNKKLFDSIQTFRNLSMLESLNRIEQLFIKGNF